MILVAAAIMIGVIGCAPSGPEALLEADELLRAGRPAEALKKLERAKAALPDDPRLWNLLGLAYHRAGESQLAAQAYQRALARDKSNLVAVAHYNLGCLLLEQNSPGPAAEHFRSYTLTTNSAAGLVKLATAQLRLRRLDQAEATFGAALRLEPKNSEALNGVGVVHAQKNQRDAIQYFNAALQSNPGFAPAMLNAGLVAQQNPASRAIALQRFKEYLAAAPRSVRASSVQSLVEQIQTEAAQQQAASNAIAQATLKSNALLAALRATNAAPTNAPPRVANVMTNQKPPLVVAKTNVPPPQPKTNPAVVAAEVKPPVASNPPVTVVTVTSVPPPKVAIAAPPVIQDSAVEPVAVPQPKPQPIPPAESISSPVTEQTKTSPPDERKPGFFARLNPFRSRAKSSAPSNEPPRLVVLATQTNDQALEPKPEFSRYQYLRPAAPEAGDRAAAERAANLAMKAEQAGNTNEAWRNYHLAINTDPSYFEAQYNAALLALRLGDWKRALAGFEMALALKPDSINTRYHFALALKQGSFAHDAVVELNRILEAKPNEVRAHLMLGNLYAQQLNEPRQARVHYAKVLELDPRNSQSPAIRYWLAAHP